MASRPLESLKHELSVANNRDIVQKLKLYISFSSVFTY